MNVLSLFDGMSCGQIALQKLGITPTNYYASEIKKQAISVTKANFPNTRHVGDITELTPSMFEDIDLILAGSPCQDFSIARTGQGLERKGLNGDKSALFFEFVRLLKTIKPTYFLFENVKMEKPQQDLVSAILGVEPIRINSELLTFQKRDRFYWTNIPDITQPADKRISFQDHKSTNEQYLELFKVNKTPSRLKMWGDGFNGKCPNVTYREKINCLTVKQDRWNNAGLVAHGDFCRYLTTNELEAAQGVPIGYCDSLTKNQAENVLGDGWTVPVIEHIFKAMVKDMQKDEAA